ncbi:FMRFamide receptor-like [Tigriopus californicus]|uniref:FMRFamide receptor-like n=1 Tax=Tigriopus californicus TaxID=6832 RepID=UPI0027D9FE44|nr:FMRFamide receptor-like [Tigriopus californicus]
MEAQETTNSIMNESFHVNSSSSPTPAWTEEASSFDFVFEGVTLSTVTLLGLAANFLAIVVLLRPRMRSSFHTLLVALAFFDVLYLMMSQMIFGFPGLSRYYENRIYPLILPFCYGCAHIGRVGSVYLTMSVTIERYFAIVHPLRHFRGKKVLIPMSVGLTTLYNIPKFFELRYDSERREIYQTAMRQNPIYVTYYIFWSKFIFVEIIPYISIIVLNWMVMVKIYKSTSFQKKFRYRSTVRNTTRLPFEESPIRNKSRSSLSKSPRKALRLGRARDSGRGKSQGINPQTQRSNSESHPNHSSVREDSPTTRQTQEKNLAAVLIGISLLFIFCQSAKIIPDLYEVIYCRWPSDEPKDCEITTFVTTMVSVSHLLLAINSSSNFIIYAWRGTKFRAELMELIRCTPTGSHDAMDQTQVSYRNGVGSHAKLPMSSVCTKYIYTTDAQSSIEVEDEPSRKPSYLTVPTDEEHVSSSLDEDDLEMVVIMNKSTQRPCAKSIYGGQRAHSNML